MSAPPDSVDLEQEDACDDMSLTEQPVPVFFDDHFIVDQRIPVHTASSSGTHDWSVARPLEDDGFGDQLDFVQHEVEYEPTVLSSNHIDPYNIPISASDHSNCAAVVDMSAWHALVRECNWKLPVRVPVFPWERGAASHVTSSNKPTPFLNKYREVVVGSITLNSSSIGQNTQDNSTPFSRTHSTSSAAWMVVAKRIQRLQYPGDLDSKREYALTKWKTLLQQSPQHCSVGRLLLSDVLSLKDDSQLNRTMEDIFCHKSTSTLLKRGNSLSKLVLWLIATGKQVYPIEEASVYQYMYSKAATSPSFAMNLKEALNFAHGTLGIDGAREAACSARVAGFCRKRVLDRRPVKQAQVLTVKQVTQLENAMNLDIDDLDKCFIGHCLFCIYSRARWSDALYFKSIFVDDNEHGSGYVQCDTLVSKTSSTLSKKRRFLPLTAVKNGIESFTWVDDWLLARSKCKLPEPDGKQPNIRSVLKNGSFGKAPLNCSDASKWLRDVLILTGSSKSEVSNVSTHSLKATTLSWCSKAGVSEERRRLLGYHTQPGSVALLHYSRDALSGPLRALEHVMELIRNKKFFPDSSRSGYFVDIATEVNPNPRPPIQAKIGDRVEVDTDDQEDGTDSSSSSDSKANSDDELLAKNISVCQEVTKARRTKHAGDILYMHKRWKTIHKSHDESDYKLACGRTLSLVFQRLHEYPSFDYSQCSFCFGA